ncbi:uncharacterized protein LOC128390535 [Panonychus citri]|uniref:uncharacterized protein LOC128390535 n=1 Tax=Panonychus citri TaxID=50023 RepID=UPI0023074257|nr:uncharacterized protein LOC128390535 [Panonychus citri]
MLQFSGSIVFSMFLQFLFSISFIIFHSCEAFTCPDKGKTGASQVPLITSLVAHQTGYQTKIELVTGSGHLFTIDETFNQLNFVGNVKVNDGAGYQHKFFWYHLEAKESFFVGIDQSCSAKNLTDNVKKSIINDWLAYSRLSDETDISNDPQVLGPMLLFTYMRSKLDNLRYLDKVNLDGRQVYQWFYCLKDDGPYIDVYFDSNNNFPVRLVATYPDDPTLTTTLNVITFEPLTNQLNDLITYPYGYGCERLNPSTIVIPQFAQADTFTLDMEAALFFTQPDRSAVTTARIARYQGIYSYDLKENGLSKRIVHDPKLLIDFQIDPISGSCFEDQASNGAGYGFTYLRWPYAENEAYNLLDDSVLNLESKKLNYMGQIVEENKRLDIFEAKLNSFFAFPDDAKFDGLVTYFFPAIYDKRQSVRNQAPLRMVIKPSRELTEIYAVKVVEKIDIKVIEYQEKAIDFEDRFDISECFDKPEDYTWFQIVFSGKKDDLESWKDQDEVLKSITRKVLSFIPEIRIPDIQVSYLGSVVYISCKLLERPSYQYDFYKTPGFTVENPTKIIQRDHEQDCGEICSEDEFCTNFAYCNNLECRLFSSTKGTTYPFIEESTDCDGFSRNNYFVSPKTQVEANFLKSSKSLIHEIKAKISKGELNVKDPNLSALDLFIVSGPDELGDPDKLFQDDDVGLTNIADHYQVFLSGRRLSQGNSMLGLDYSSCLNECDNDDNCLIVSFCSSRKGECILGNSTENINQESTYSSEGCNILSRSYSSFFKKLPGRSLIFDAEQTLENISVEDCARACVQSSSKSCEAFDYCPEAGMVQNSKTKIKACFLHTFHLAKDSASAIDGKIWNFTETQCDHYAKILSKDYKQLVGYKFNLNEESMILQTSDVSLENCAGSCITTGNCKSFDYCENQSQSGMITSKCRLSSIKPDAKSSKSLESSIERCSIYVTTYVDPNTINSSKSHSKAWLLISLSFFTFIIAFTIGLVAARYYYKR